MTDDKRTQTISALREFADLLESQPSLPVPYFGGAFASVGSRLPHAGAVNELFDLAEILGADVLVYPDGKHEIDIRIGGLIEYQLHVHKTVDQAALPKIATRPPRTTSSTTPTDEPDGASGV